MGRGKTTSYKGVSIRSEASITIDFRYYGKRCRETLDLKPTPANLNKAAIFREEVIQAIKEEVFDYAVSFPNSKHAGGLKRSKIPTVKEYLEQWIDYVKPHFKASTYNTYRKDVFNRLIPTFGHLYLNELRRKHVKDFAMSLDCSTKRLGNIISTLRVSLDDAVEDEIIHENPLTNWKIRRKRGKALKKRDNIDPFTNEEREAIIVTAKGQARNFIRFAFWTGLRTSELIALDWGDIDWIRGVVFVNKAITAKSKEAEETKTDAGEREVKLLPEALRALQDQKRHTFLKGDEIFQNPRTLERFEDDQQIRKGMWIPILKKAGVRYRYPYQTRHTYASMSLMAGEDIRWVSRQLGHTDWAFTAKTYTRYIPDDAPNAGNKVADMYGEKA